MRPAYAVDILTPKKFLLRGLWFGPRKAKRVIIFVHGLTASAFSMGHLVRALTDTSTAVLTFNNRGFERVTELKRGSGKNAKWVPAGATHEVFTECVDDVQGAVNFVRRQGVKNIFIAGHSTGAQKAVYWAHKNGKGVRGLILLGPLSDYAGADKGYKRGAFQAAVAHAKKLVKAGKPHELMPKHMTTFFQSDAQRFLSLNTPDSIEQRIFSYFDAKIKPNVFESVRIPMLSVFAEADEHGDRPAAKITSWFEVHSRAKHSKTFIVPRAKHSFRGDELKVARAIRNWIRAI